MVAEESGWTMRALNNKCLHKNGNEKGARGFFCERCQMLRSGCCCCTCHVLRSSSHTDTTWLPEPVKPDANSCATVVRIESKLQKTDLPGIHPKPTVHTAKLALILSKGPRLILSGYE